MLQRRGLIIGAIGLIAAPAICKAENLMRISTPKFMSRSDLDLLVMKTEFQERLRSIAPGFMQLFSLIMSDISLDVKNKPLIKTLVEKQCEIALRLCCEANSLQ